MKRFLAAIFPLLVSCGVNEGIVIDDTMTDLLCPPGKDIFTGSDGAISVPVGKDTSVWFFGDSFMGEVQGNTRDSLSNPLIYGNIFVELAGDKARTICGGTPQNPSAVVPCDSIGGQQAVYWPHHGFVENGILHAYMIRIVFDPVLWFMTDGKLLVSYCINSHRPGRLWEDVSVYRPRFLRVPYSLILGQNQ